MSRNDGSFPPYKRLELDPNAWPGDYWDAARFCSQCETYWPSDDLFKMSPCCGVETTVTKDTTPDMRWPEAITRLKRAYFDKWYDEYNEGVDDVSLYWEEEKVKEELAQFLDEIQRRPVKAA